ncbi:MAG: CHAD domain-containing protein [Phascolarctobacterium sp.]|nr:CHAD domain-containing protein [Phascolarctobacterium sp.]
MKNFLCLRFSKWSDRLESIQKKYPDLHNAAQMHKIRIKLKRFRYALQAVPKINYPEALLRSLKVLQDTLGLLHDAYVNGRLIDDILLEQKGNETLPYLWENLYKQLGSWREDNL